MYLISLNDKFGQVIYVKKVSWCALIMLTLFELRQKFDSLCKPQEARTLRVTRNPKLYLLHSVSADWLPHPSTGLKMFWVGPNFLCQTKYWFRYVLCRFQTYCARPKDNFHSVNFVFVPALNEIWFLAKPKNIWTGTKHFGTCKRTRH